MHELLCDNDNLNAKCSAVKIREDGGNCLLCAILVAWAYRRKIDKFLKLWLNENEDIVDIMFRNKRSSSVVYKDLRKKMGKFQDRVLEKLLSLTVLDPPSTFSLEEISVIENFLECGVYI